MHHACSELNQSEIFRIKTAFCLRKCHIFSEHFKATYVAYVTS